MYGRPRAWHCQQAITHQSSQHNTLEHCPQHDNLWSTSTTTCEKETNRKNIHKHTRLLTILMHEAVQTSMWLHYDVHVEKKQVTIPRKCDLFTTLKKNVLNLSQKRKIDIHIRAWGCACGMQCRYITLNLPIQGCRAWYALHTTFFRTARAKYET